MRILLACMVGALLAPPALAQPACEPVAQEERDAPASQRLAAWLRQKQFAAIEDELNDKLGRYGRRDYPDLLLYWDLDAAVPADPSLEPLLAQWVASQPGSFFARLFKGQHHAAMGRAKRGSGFSSETSAEQVDAMEREFAKAVAELKEASTLKPGSALPLAGLMMISRATGGAPVTRKFLAQANKADPANMAARWVAARALSPKWGGSFDDLDAIVPAASRAGLPAAQVRHLQYAVEMQKADHFSVVTKEKTKAIAHWRQAAEACVAGEPLRLLVAAAYDLEDWKTVKEVSTRQLRLRPRDGSVIQRRGWANEQMGQIPEALKDYETAAEFGEPWAQNRLGYYLMIGQHLPKDTVRARQLLEASAAKGNPTARANLEALGR